MKKHVLLLPLILTILIKPLGAESAVPDFDGMIAKAEYAFYEKANRKRTDFWVARFLGLSGKYPESGYGIKNVEAFLKKRKLTPKAFFPDDWDPGFVEWYEKSIYTRWAVDDNKVREKHRSFEIAEGLSEGKYFAKVVASPEIEMWHLVHQGILKKPVWMAMASAADKPALFFGKIMAGTKGLTQAIFVLINSERRNLHYVWQPEFYDMDQDGTKEIWLRFNMGWGNGFAQILDIYKINDKEGLVLAKRFKAEPEGFVRRLPDGTVERAFAHGSHDRLTRMQYDLHHVETWEFQADEWKLSAEKDIPFVYKTPQWKEYL